MNLLKTFAVFLSPALLISCSPAHQLSKSAKETILDNTALQTAHVGISIYEPATGKYWYNHQGDKYFVPASNTKIPTCYAAMKYLGDSLVGLKVREAENRVYIAGTGDPTFLLPEFKVHPVYQFLKYQTKDIWAGDFAWRDNAWGSGWSWSDYGESYLAERSAFPIYGNVVRFSGTKNAIQYYPKRAVLNKELPTYSNNGATGFIDAVDRQLRQNDFKVRINGKVQKEVEVPFITSSELAFRLLEDTLKKQVIGPNVAPVAVPEILKDYVIHSQPTDSLLKPMMHRSDNFFAEQSLLMVSNERLGIMSDEKIIDTLLKTDFKDLPQKPRWVDGSGLSRYNLFTPQDMVAILNKMQAEFGMNRIKTIFATGNEGTLANYYKAESGYLYAKTGTLSGIVALSGFLETVKGKHLIFSVLVNNHQASATAVRRAVEGFIEGVRNKF